MKYKVLKKFGNVEVGTVLETDATGVIEYRLNEYAEAIIEPHDIAIMLHAGFLEEVDGKWKPNIGEKYYFIDSTLLVDSFNYYDTGIHKDIVNSGNCFRTESEAQAKLDEVLKVLGK